MASERHEVRCLVTVIPKSPSSYMFHYPNLTWTALQAEAMRLPQVIEHTEGEKEKELADLERALKRAKQEYYLDGVCTGALASVYQKTRVEKVCESIGLSCLSPLWGLDPEEHLRRLVADGFRISMVSVSALGLDRSWLGRILDGPAVDELLQLSRKYKFHAGLEGGEGETFVLDCPMFSSKVEIKDSVVHWERDSGYLEIKDAALSSK